MTSEDHLGRPIRLRVPPPPSLARLQSAVARVHSRWPDIVPEGPEKDREVIVQRVLRRLDRHEWEDASLREVVQAARAVFTEEFRERSDLARLRHFYIRETRATDQPGFLGAMMSIYLSTYEPTAAHTRALASALTDNRVLVPGRWRRLLERFSDILEPRTAPESVASAMLTMVDPWAELRAAGFSPHAPGLMDYAHQEFVRRLAPELYRRDRLEFLFDWLAPPGREARSAGAPEAVAAVLSHWIERSPSEDLQAFLVERLVALYRDPRITKGEPWMSLQPDLLRVVMRWLTGENIRLFLDIVSQVEAGGMWEPRRKFWLGLYEQGRIDAAWVAFSRDAAAVAAGVAARDGRSSLAYGLQAAGGTRVKTSLLILQIGDCIVVEGSHSYKVRIFKRHDSKAPVLFEPSYDCERIRDILPKAAIQHKGRWEDRVERELGYLS